MARVDLRKISKNYPGLKALDDVTLSVRSGEFFTLLGPSGCGKTTLLRTVAGFNRQDDGEVLVDGRRIDEGSTLLRTHTPPNAISPATITLGRVRTNTPSNAAKAARILSAASQSSFAAL